jgi:tetratricopeptide (TPR) repeat protein
MSAHTIFTKKLASKNSLYYLFCFLCLSIVGVNIFASQKYHPTLYGVMDGDTISAISYLKHIWGTRLFSMEIDTYKKDQNTEVLAGWEKIQTENKQRIINLENASRLHPYAPEIYYNLFLLYSENGEKEKALQNLQKAQAIDPSLK